MKLTLEEHFTSASGRACRNNEVYNRTNRHTGQVVAVKLCNPCKGEPTEAQQSIRDAMKIRVTAARAWRKANAPSAQHPQGTAEYQALYRMWKSDHRFANWYSLLLSKIKDGNVPSFTDGDNETTTGTPTQPSGGNTGGTSGGSTGGSSTGGGSTSPSEDIGLD